ncbi:MAG TPA: ligase-associated DNA damage response exonuclease, partial [Planctomycetota bacterium]|nr:ligase-associated DNA damage response exonuclease [Planctomycetota bacterium]
MASAPEIRAEKLESGTSGAESGPKESTAEPRAQERLASIALGAYSRARPTRDPWRFAPSDPRPLPKRPTLTEEATLETMQERQAPAAMVNERLVRWSSNGLYCEAGGFYIDPRRAVDRAVITHAHGDHLKRGSGEYIASRSGIGLVAHRVSSRARFRPLEFGEPVELGSVRVTLFPAGHVLGSAQVRIEHAGKVWVISGDYKRESDPSCEPFEPVLCDTFVTEATFARAHFQWQTSDPVGEIFAWWEDGQRTGRASILYSYALGKAQRVLASLRRFTDRRVLVHPYIDPINECYRAAGIELLPTETLPRMTAGRSFAGELILAPPRYHRESWYRRFGRRETGFASGWMTRPGAARARGFDRGFGLSDHADWPALLRTIEETGATRVLVMHGHAADIVSHLRTLG